MRQTNNNTRLFKFSVCILIITGCVGNSFSQRQHAESYSRQLLQLTKEWSTHKYFDQRVFDATLDMDEILLYGIRQLNIEKDSNWKPGWICDTIGKSCRNDTTNITSTSACFEKAVCFAGQLDTSRYQYIRSGFSANLAADSKYHKVSKPNKELRLLAFCRLYGALYCFAPFKDSGIKSLDTLFVNHILKVTSANNKTDYNLELMRFMSALSDGHAIPFSPQRETFFGRYRLPFICEFFDDHAIVSEIINKRKCRRYNIRLGDTVISIDNDFVPDRIDKLSTFISVTNEKFRSDLCLNTGFNTKTCHVVFTRAGKSHQVDVKLDRTIIHMVLKLRKGKGKPQIQTFQDSIVYVNLLNMNKKDYDNLYKELSKPISGLIVDVRGYPRTGNLEMLLDLISKENSTISVASCPSRTNFGCFDESFDTIGRNHDEPIFSGKLVVLVNETTISQGEYTCMALQSLGHRTKVVGSKTAGCNGNICMILLPGRVSAMFTGMGIMYPDRTPTQNRGVKIDFEIRRNIENVLEHADPELNYAIELLRSQKNRSKP